MKDDPKQRIIDAALDEFLDRGYGHASMRAIAAQAGMTVGNIYLYFTGKERLFEALVGETVEKLRWMMAMQDASDESLRWLALRLHGIFLEKRVEFLILITRSEGSPYRGFKEEIIDFAARKLEEQYGTGESNLRFHPVSVALIEGLIDIFHRFPSEGHLTDVLYFFLNHMLSGLTAREPTEEATWKE